MKLSNIIDRLNKWAEAFTHRTIQAFFATIMSPWLIPISAIYGAVLTVSAVAAGSVSLIMAVPFFVLSSMISAGLFITFSFGINLIIYQVAPLFTKEEISSTQAAWNVRSIL